LPHTDFDIFSTLEDAQKKRNPWDFIKYGEEEEGFPGDSGPSNEVPGQWASLTKAGGAASVRFSIPVYHPCIFGMNDSIIIRQDPNNCDDIVAANPDSHVRSPYGRASGKTLTMFDTEATAIVHISLEAQYGEVGAIKWPDGTMWVKRDCNWFAGDYVATPPFRGSASVKCHQEGCTVTCMREDAANVTGIAVGNTLTLPDMTGNGGLDMMLESINWEGSDEWRRTPPIP